MHATITSDASFNRKTKIGTYAFWLAVNETRTKRRGKLKDKLNTPTEAEFKCVLNALFVLSQKRIPGLNYVIINTDSLNVIHVCERDKKAIKKYKLWYLESLFFQYDKMVKEMGVRVKFKHINAHNNTDSKSYFVNDWCDREAKAVMALELAKLDMKHIEKLAKSY